MVAGILTKTPILSEAGMAIERVETSYAHALDRRLVDCKLDA